LHPSRFSSVTHFAISDLSLAISSFTSAGSGGEVPVWETSVRRG
jgi:hypothetical protein